MKRIAIFFLAFSFGAFAYGQIVQSIGVKTGLSIANQTWHYKTINLTLKKDYRPGFYSAVTMDFLKSSYFNLSADIAYCQKGSIEKIIITSPNSPEAGTYKSYNTKLDYFTFSPLLKAKFETSHWIPYVLLGARLDYLLGYTSDFDYSQLENDFNKTILGATTGLGIEYRIKYIGINTELQYHYDLTKLIDIPSSATSAGLEANNKAFIINLGIKYYLHKKAA